MKYVAGSARAVETSDTYLPKILRTKARQTLAKRPLILKQPIDEGGMLYAYVNHARWVVDCPNCNSAETAWEDGYFMCSECHNSDVGGKLKRVVMPINRKGIENALSVRQPLNRNWFINETLDDLIAENIKHGVN